MSVIPDMPRLDYEAHDRENFSSLKHIARSPLHYLQAKKGKETTSAQRRGIATHVACLEPERFDAQVKVFDGDNRRTKAWDAFETAWGKTHELLTAPEYEVVKASAIAVRSHKVAMRYLSEGEGEVTILWEEMGVKLKSRLDWLSPLAACDLKSTKSGSPTGFPKEVANYETLAQAAMYTDAIAFAGLAPRPYKLIAVESDAPHAVQVFNVSPALIEVGRHQYRGWLRKLLECRASGEWPAYSTGELELVMPSWFLTNREAA